VDSIALPPDMVSVAAARRFVYSVLVHRLSDPSVALLLTSELVTNVIRHAATDFTVAVTSDPGVRVEVHDGVAATDAFRDMLANALTDVPAKSPGGRGLGLVRALASRVGLDDEPGASNGKVVWFELDDADIVTRP
jgi:anti-sigma regulatory factor (Ser/Thr protein kinase)